MDSNYGLFAVKGVDWRALERVYRPQAESAQGEEELIKVLAGILSHLNDKHVWLISSNFAWNCRMKAPCRLADVDNAMNASKAPFSERLVYEKYVRDRRAHSPEITSGFLTASVGYLRITALPDDVSSVGAAADQVMERLRDVRTMVVDIRGNRGGSDRGAKAIADRFADRQRLFMTTSIRSGKQPDDFTKPIAWHVEPAGPRQFTGQVALLVNRDTFSAGETFALAMRVLPHVTIAGETTAGAFSDADDAVLPRGWRLTYSKGVWRDAKGKLWEGAGLPPDIDLRVTADGLAAGKDAAIEWAIRHLGGERN